MNQDKLDFYKKQIELEHLISERAEKSVANLDNILIRELVKAIAIDSQKHIGMLKALISLRERPTPSMAEAFGEELKASISEHIRLEQQAITTYQHMLSELKNDSERLIIQAILDDEQKHHNLLVKIRKIIVEQYSLSEKDLWQMVEESYLDFGE